MNKMEQVPEINLIGFSQRLLLITSRQTHRDEEFMELRKGSQRNQIFLVLIQLIPQVTKQQQLSHLEKQNT